MYMYRLRKPTPRRPHRRHYALSVPLGVRPEPTVIGGDPRHYERSQTMRLYDDPMRHYERSQTVRLYEMTGITHYERSQTLRRY